MKAYSSEQRGWLDFINEARSLYVAKINNAKQRVNDQLAELSNVKVLLKAKFGVELSGLDILEIGPGQFLTQLTSLAVNNRATGVDLELIAQGCNPLLYLRMAQANGLRRTIKTIGRKLLGIDRKYAQELREQLGLKLLPTPSVLQADASQLSFGDQSFDFVYCRSVLQHVPQPAAVLKEVNRVLRPSGVVYFSVHLYTSETGSLDPRVFSEELRGQTKGWPHLRPQLQHTVKTNAYLNKLRLAEWKSVFETCMPGTEFILSRSRTEADRIHADATALKSTGELADYSLEELETFEIVAIWQKT